MKNLISCSRRGGAKTCSLALVVAVSFVVATGAILPTWAETYVWNGASGDDWATPASWLVGGAAPATVPTSADNIEFNSASDLTVGGATTLAVTQILHPRNCIGYIQLSIIICYFSLRVSDSKCS